MYTLVSGRKTASTVPLPIPSSLSEMETTKRLAKIWQHVLGGEVGIHDNFFDLGGNSLLAVTLIGEVEGAFGQRLPLASLIQAPTIHEFTDFLAGNRPKKLPWSSLVTLNAEGKRTPLFLVHSHGGNVLEYLPLAQRLGRERPLFALQARGLDGNIVEEPCIEEMASYYLREIRVMQPHGPYYLGGFCFGGFLALEAAHQLRSQGETVDLVVMINTVTKEYPVYATGRLLAGFNGLRYRCALEWSNLFDKQSQDVLGRLSGRLKRVRDVAQARAEGLLDRTLSHLNRPMKQHSLIYQLEHLGATHDRAWLAYEPKPYDGKVLLIRAQRQSLGICSDPALGWGGLLTGDVQMIETPGFRQNMMDEPNIGSIAEAMTDSMHECEAAQPAPQVLCSNTSAS
jgi:thioesterase domain-containing protein/acyl carrier protein